MAQTDQGRKFLTPHVHRTGVTVQNTAVFSPVILSKDQVRMKSVIFFQLIYPLHASKFTITNEDSIKTKPLRISQKGKIAPPVGLEPTTFELEVQHASPLRHGGLMSMEKPYSDSIYSLYFKTPL